MAAPIPSSPGLAPDIELSRTPRQALQWLFVAIATAGAYSPARVFPALEPLGFLVDPRVVIGAMLFGVALLLFVSRGGELRASPKEWLWFAGFFLLHLFVAASRIWSETPWMADGQLTDLTLLMLFTLVFARLFADDWRYAVHLMLAASVVFSLPFLALAMLLFATGATDAMTAGFASGAGGIGMSRLFGLASVAVFYYYLRSGRRWVLLLLPLYLAGIMVSGSRAALLALIVALGFLWWRRKSVRPKDRSSWLVKVLAAIAGLLALVVFFLTPFGLAIFEAFVISNIAGSTEVDAGGVYLADRDVIFADALRLALEHPLTGLGIGSYRGPYGEPYPHNLVLLYGVDAGAMPALLLLVFFAVFAVQALRCKADWAVSAAATGIFLLVASLFAGSYYDARVFWFMSLALTAHGADSVRVARLPDGPLQVVERA